MLNCWASLQRALHTALRSAEENWQDYYALSCTVPISQDDASALSWLKGQQHFPQCVWQPRNQSHLTLALGQVALLSDLACAQAVVDRTALSLIGGVKFDGSAQFLLPRLMLSCSETAIHATLCLQAGEEKSAVAHWLDGLREPLPIAPITTALRFTSQAYNQAQWCALVTRALAAIDAGEFVKVVPAQMKCYDFDSPFCALDFIAHAKAQQPQCYGFLWAQSPTQAFFGISPERFYHRTGCLLHTEALAGTVKCGEHTVDNQRALAWLMQDNKNSHENHLVVEDIVHKLTPLAYQIEVGELEGRVLGYVQHLARPISARLKSAVSDAQCTHAIHPSAAVGGLPKAPALAFLKQHNIERGWYAGTFGLMSQKCSEFCVAIRCADRIAGQIRVYAGAGIVRGSDPLLEWQEIERKTAGILSVLHYNGR
ncbi:isochorismate synthase [Pasteurellaceae bacterium HPA106]|uniref:isochorismate synthase n=1 Tax=Spirabiliibacterium pneumoniae TaxID=221400 RepID=UPI001AAC7AE1|nr:isochorismate synthase [Spirabiliibacterium pneumoniae]MBE2896458.1 isochorismate synthase [Spirabiliibacterium pneumoniae]